MAELSLFNVNHGFNEALIRGLRSGFMGPADYRRISSAESLEDVRSAMEETDYGTFLQDEASPLSVATITRRCYEKLAREFRFVKAQSSEPLTTFMDFIAREKMIDNVCMIIQGALNNKAPKDLLDKIHPMGDFEGMKVIMSESFDVKENFENVYRIFLVDTPIGPYFEDFLRESAAQADGEASGVGKHDTSQVDKILSQQDLELMKVTLKKAWLEDFYSFTSQLGGTTEEVMGHMLMMEADFRVLLVTMNSLNTSLSAEQKLSKRNSLYPSFGYLYPAGTFKLADAWNDQTVQAALEPFKDYLSLVDSVKDFYDKSTTNDKSIQSIEDLIYSKSVHMYELAFEQQYHFGVFYAWVKLREQEIRNIRFICDMVVLNRKEEVDSTIVPIFDVRMK